MVMHYVSHFTVTGPSKVHNDCYCQYSYSSKL